MLTIKLRNKINNYYLNFGPQHPAAHGIILANIFIRQIKDENGVIIKEVYDWYVIGGSIAFSILVIGIIVYLSSNPPDGSFDGSLVSNTGNSCVKHQMKLLHNLQQNSY